VLYNLAVVRELAKQVYAAERLAPPASLGGVANAYGALWQRARSPAYWREIAENGEWKKVALYGAEAYGIYKVRRRDSIETQNGRSCLCRLGRFLAAARSSDTLRTEHRVCACSRIRYNNVLHLVSCDLCCV
jgi:hypothetical protein